MTVEERKADFKSQVLKQFPKAVQTESGLMYTVEKAGVGEPPKKWY